MRRRPATLLGVGITVGAVGALVGLTGPGSDAAATRPAPTSVTRASVLAASPAAVVGKGKGKTKTPIKHVVVIFDENISYDHYFGTYPKATNTDGVKFKAVHARKTHNNNLVSSGLLTSNPNQYAPFRLSPSQAMTCDQNHGYTAEQLAFDSGLMDQFVQHVSNSTCTGLTNSPGLTMGYFDGNTVTGLWNYAQNFALSDSFFGSTFGPSTPGAINLVSGNTHGFKEIDPATGLPVIGPASATISSPDANGVGTLINDPDPAYDDCSDGNHASTNHVAAATGQNIGDLLNRKKVTWGWFQGGFTPSATSTTGLAVCGTAHTNIGGASVVDYSPHHNPFAYYASTANPHHLPPSSISKVGKTDQANHNYDLTTFASAVKAGSMPEVSFLKAGSYQDGHAGYSDPIDEQHFLVDQINLIQKSKYWKDTAIVIAYDDSDGWYDHVVSPVMNSSHDATPTGDAAICALSTSGTLGGYQDRCGPGPRLPMLVISPYARADFVDHHATEQASIIKFIEDNWKTGRIGDSSFDLRAGNLKHMFDFHQARDIQLLLKPTGAVKRKRGD